MHKVSHDLDLRQSHKEIRVYYKACDVRLLGVKATWTDLQTDSAVGVWPLLARTLFASDVPSPSIMWEIIKVHSTGQM